METFIEKILDGDGNWSIVLVNKKLNIIEEVALFLNYLKIKGLSPNTVDNYCRDMRVYFNWLNENTLYFYNVTKRDMISFIGYVQESVGNKRVKSPRTINRYLATLSSFYRYYEGIGGYIEENPITVGGSDDFKGKKFSTHKSQQNIRGTNFFRQKETKKKNNKRLFPAQIEKMYDAIDLLTDQSDVAVRNKLIFRLLYESGLRIGECLGLRIMDYSEPNPSEKIGVIYVREYPDLYHKDHSIKTNTRAIPVSMDLIFNIDDYVCTIRPQIKKFDTIFVNHRGNSLGYFMRRDNMTKFFRELSSYTGIKCTAHTLRHTHGTELSESGYHQEYIRDRMGHNSYESTNTYMHLSLESQINAYEKFIAEREGLTE